MKTKTILATCTVFFLISAAIADETTADKNTAENNNSPSILLNIKEAKFSGYGAPYVRYSRIGEAHGCLAGVRGGVIINDNFVFGFGGMGLATPTDRDKISGEYYTGLLSHAGFGYGGFLTEYYFNPKDLIVVSAGTLIGGGALVFYDQRYKDYDDDDYYNDHRHYNDDDGDIEKGDSFFVVEPELNVFVNITRFCRIGAGVSYRYVAGINSDEFSNKDFRGPSASIMAQFGWF